MGARGPIKEHLFLPCTLASLGIERSILMRCHNQIAVLCFMPREVIYLRLLFCAVLSSLSMVKAAIAIPADVLKPACLAAIPLPEPPAVECLMSLSYGSFCWYWVTCRLCLTSQYAVFHLSWRSLTNSEYFLDGLQNLAFIFLKVFILSKWPFTGPLWISVTASLTNPLG